jgi:hypothetical protein
VREKNAEQEEGSDFKDNQNRYVRGEENEKQFTPRLALHSPKTHTLFPSTSRDSLLMLQNIQQEMDFFFVY